jgi:hypothetical protein
MNLYLYLGLLFAHLLDRGADRFHQVYAFVVHHLLEAIENFE